MTIKLSDLQIRSKNSVDDKALLENIKHNMNVIKNWIRPSVSHNHKALMISAGRSLKGHLDGIKKKQEEGYKIFCIKHALPKLVEAGIEPDGVFILDPRTIEGYSTHGVKRADLYATVPKNTILFVASMTAKDVTDHLISLGVKVVGWHAAVTGLLEYLQSVGINDMMINNGTSSATRAIGVLRMLGFRHLELVAFDSDVEEPTEAQKRERNVEGPMKYSQVVDDDGSVFWSTGELLAQVQDLKQLVGIYEPQYDYFDMWEGGLGYRAFSKEKQRRKELYDNRATGLETVDFDLQMQKFRSIG